MLFWGTILSSTLRAGPSTSEVKRHKVLSTSKYLALFCSGLVILLANEASEAISEYRVPVARRCSRDYVRGCSSLKSSRRPPVPATLMRRRTFVQRRSANSFSIYYRSSSLLTYMSRAYIYSSVQLSPFFESYDDYIYECDEPVPTAVSVCHSYIQAAAL